MPADAALLEKLMACQPISSAPAQVNQAVRILRDYLESAAVYTETATLGEREILYAATVPERTVDVLLNTHLDVVPADTADDYVLTQKNGWYCGRGTVDCLGNAVATACALVAANGKASAGAIFSTDEEIGGQTTLAMVTRGYRARRIILVLDVSDYYQVATAQKGVLTLRLEACGKACHAAEPWKGENAFDKLVNGYRKIKGLFPPVMPPDEWQNTMAATIMHAGTAANKVPDKAEMILNIRLTENTDADEVIQQIKDLSGLAISCEMRCPPMHSDPDSGEIRHLLEHFEQGLGHPLHLKKLNGATDARHFVDMHLPIALLGVPGHDPHGAEERIEIAGFETFPRVLASYLFGMTARLFVPG